MEEIQTYLQKLKKDGEHSVNTLRSYSNDLRRLENFLKIELNGNAMLENVSIEHFQNFLESEYSKGFQPSTLHRRKVVLHQFATYLFDLNGLSKDDVEKLAGWRQDIWQEINQRDLEYLTELECEKLTKTIQSEKSPRVYRDLSIISLLLETGLSIKHIIGINLSDLDLRATRARVYNGVKQIWYEIPNSVNYLKEYLALSRPELTQSANEEALFVSQMGGRITRQGVWQIVKGWGETADLSTTLSPRILRHTAVRRMLKSKKPVSEIQNLLGHSNIMSTRALIRKLTRKFSDELEDN